MGDHISGRFELLVVFVGFAVCPQSALAQEEQKPAVLKGHKGEVTHMAFSPTDRNVLATASKDRSILLWDVPKEKAVASLASKDEGFDSVESLAFAPDGKYLAVWWKKGKPESPQKNKVLIWATDGPQEKPAWQLSDCQAPSFSPDGRMMAYVDSKTGDLVASTVDAKEGPKEKVRLKQPPKSRNVYLGGRFAPEGNWLLVYQRAYPADFSAVGFTAFAEIVDLETKERGGSITLQDTFNAALPRIGMMAFLSSDQILGVDEGKGKGMVWNLSRTGKLKGEPSTFTLEEADNLRSAFFVPGQKARSAELVTVHFAKAEFQVRRWQIKKGDQGKPDVEELKLDGSAKWDPGHDDPRFALAADGAAVAVTSVKNAVEVYRIPPAKK